MKGFNYWVDKVFKHDAILTSPVRMSRKKKRALQPSS
jgi:hypothetical protein